MPSNNNGYTKCPFSYGLFLGTASLMVMAMKQQRQKKQTSTLPSLPICEVVFVLGGPGAGKGTQCALLEERLGDHKHTSSRWLHLSAGDLLRAERNRKSQLSQIINAKIANGELVPSSITCQLLEQAMVEAWQKQKITKFLIDGFPRSHENMEAWQQNASLKHHTLKFVLNFECPEEVLVGRLLERGKDSGRSDDNIETIRKRFHTHQTQCQPILNYFESELHTPVHTIDSAKPVEKVYQSVVGLFS